MAKETSTLAQARAHARSLAGAAAETGPVVPTPGGLVWEERIGVGGYASRLLPRDAVLRIEDREGDACVQLVALAAGNPAERLNVADTVKVQWQAYLDEGALLLSDMGRVLLTFVEDTSGRHDALCGAGSHRTFDTRWGDGAVSSPTPNPRDLLCLAALKHGLTRRDVPPWINLFKSVRVAADGALLLDGAPAPDSEVALRCEVDVVVLLANTPHPLDDRDEYRSSTVTVSASIAPRSVVDPVRTSTPERERAFLNTDEALR